MDAQAPRPLIKLMIMSACELPVLAGVEEPLRGDPHQWDQGAGQDNGGVPFRKSRDSWCEGNSARWMLQGRIRRNNISFGTIMELSSLLETGSARMYDYLLGGKDNFAADREAGDPGERHRGGGPG
jgi:hypothetical protein